MEEVGDPMWSCASRRAWMAPLGDGERTDVGAATSLSFSQNRVVKAKVTEVFLQVSSSRFCAKHCSSLR